MKPMIKTDKCVKVLGDVLWFISPTYLLNDSGFDKNLTFRGLTRMRALLGYTICPIVEIKVNSFDDKDALLVWMKEHQLWTGEPYFDEVWNVLQKEVITTTDLEYEFIENCPDLDSIPQSLNITRVKFKEILSSLPNEDTYSLRNLLSGSNNNIYSQKIKELESAGIITASEAKEILEHIGVIISNLHNIARGIMGKYNELKEMAGTTQNKYNSLFNALNKYVIGDAGTLRSIIEHKNPNGEKMKWSGRPVEAVIFADSFLDGSFSSFNKCFELPDGKELKSSHRGGNPNTSYPIYSIIQMHKH